MTRSFEQAGFRKGDTIVTEDYIFTAYPNFQEDSTGLIRYANGDFVSVTGTCIADGECPAKRLYHERDTAGAMKHLSGHYAIVIRRNGKTDVTTDPFGGYHVYYSEGAGIVSTSFLSIASALTQLTISRQSLFEYVFNGVVSGNDTIFKEIRLLPIQATLSINKSGFELIRPRLFVPSTTSAQDRRSSQERTIELLDRFFARVIHSFGYRVGTAISGGYDSRLILAFLRRHGATQPRLYVYGGRDDGDVRIASEIASGEHLRLAVINKDSSERIAPSSFCETLYKNFIALDGYGYPGIFNNGAEVRESARRVEGRSVAFNGGGGEIFRNFFYLPDRRYTVRQLLWTFYSQFDPRCTTRLFDVEIYYRQLEGKIKVLIGSDDSLLRRPTVEWLYHNFRCRAWDGKVDSLANRFGHTAMPFLEREITEHASMLPLPWKEHGSYEAEIIKMVDPRLAAYGSVYGHSFSHPPPFRRRLQDHISLLRPPWLRRYAHRVKHRRVEGPKRRQEYLGPEYVRAALPDGADIMPRLFRLDLVYDSDQYARILSLEYAFHQFGSRVRTGF